MTRITWRTRKLFTATAKNQDMAGKKEMRKNDGRRSIVSEEVVWPQRKGGCKCEKRGPQEKKGCPIGATTSGVAMSRAGLRRASDRDGNSGATEPRPGW